MEVIERRGAATDEAEEGEDEKAACGGTGGRGPFLLEADLEMRLEVVACGCCACARPGGVIMMGCCFWRLSRISRHLPTRCSCSGRTSGEISRSCWDSACSST